MPFSLWEKNKGMDPANPFMFQAFSIALVVSILVIFGLLCAFYALQWDCNGGKPDWQVVSFDVNKLKPTETLDCELTLKDSYRIGKYAFDVQVGYTRKFEDLIGFFNKTTVTDCAVGARKCGADGKTACTAADCAPFEFGKGGATAHNCNSLTKEAFVGYIAGETCVEPEGYVPSWSSYSSSSSSLSGSGSGSSTSAWASWGSWGSWSSPTSSYSMSSSSSSSSTATTGETGTTGTTPTPAPTPAPGGPTNATDAPTPGPTLSPKTAPHQRHLLQSDLPLCKQPSLAYADVAGFEYGSETQCSYTGRGQFTGDQEVDEANTRVSCQGPDRDFWNYQLYGTANIDNYELATSWHNTFMSFDLNFDGEDPDYGQLMWCTRAVSPFMFYSINEDPVTGTSIATIKTDCYRDPTYTNTVLAGSLVVGQSYRILSTTTTYKPNQMVAGVEYTILSTKGSSETAVETDFMLYGASNNNVGTVFIALRSGSGSGRVTGPATDFTQCGANSNEVNHVFVASSPCSGSGTVSALTLMDSNDVQLPSSDPIIPFGNSNDNVMGVNATYFKTMNDVLIKQFKSNIKNMTEMSCNGYLLSKPKTEPAQYTIPMAGTCVTNMCPRRTWIEVVTLASSGSQMLYNLCLLLVGMFLAKKYGYVDAAPITAAVEMQKPASV